MLILIYFVVQPYTAFLNLYMMYVDAYKPKPLIMFSTPKSKSLGELGGILTSFTCDP